MENIAYKSSPGNSLIKLDSFMCCNTLYSENPSLNIIEISNADTEYITTKLNEEILKLDEETPEAVENIKQQLLEELITMGYDLNNKVEPIIHN